MLYAILCLRVSLLLCLTGDLVVKNSRMHGRFVKDLCISDSHVFFVFGGPTKSTGLEHMHQCTMGNLVPVTLAS